MFVVLVLGLLSLLGISGGLMIDEGLGRKTLGAIIGLMGFGFCALMLVYIGVLIGQGLL